MDLLKPAVPTPVDVVSADEARALISEMQRRIVDLEREKAEAELEAAHAERRAGAEPVDPGMRAWEEHQLERFRTHLRDEHEVEMQSLLDAARRRATACLERAQREADLLASYAQAIGDVREDDLGVTPDLVAPPPAPPIAPLPATPIEPLSAAVADLAPADPPPPAPALADAPQARVEARPSTPPVDLPTDSRGLPVPPAPALDRDADGEDAVPATTGEGPTWAGGSQVAAPPVGLAASAALRPVADELRESPVLSAPAPTVAPVPPVAAPVAASPPPAAPADPTPAAPPPVTALDDGGHDPPAGDDGSDGSTPGGSGDDFWPEKPRSGLRGLIGRIHALAVLQVIAVVIILVVVLLRIG